MQLNGRPDNIEDYLVTVRLGGWFGWSDSKNKIYAWNLIVQIMVVLNPQRQNYVTR